MVVNNTLIRPAISCEGVALVVVKGSNLGVL